MFVWRSVYVAHRHFWLWYRVVLIYVSLFVVASVYRMACVFVPYWLFLVGGGGIPRYVRSYEQHWYTCFMALSLSRSAGGRQDLFCTKTCLFTYAQMKGTSIVALRRMEDLLWGGEGCAVC